MTLNITLTKNNKTTNSNNKQTNKNCFIDLPSSHKEITDDHYYQSRLKLDLRCDKY